jgi:hypothetical protein
MTDIETQDHGFVRVEVTATRRYARMRLSYAERAVTSFLTAEQLRLLARECERAATELDAESERQPATA